MPFQVRIIERGAILLVRAVGGANPDDWYGLADHPDLARPGAPRGLLVDLRRRQTLPTAAQARETGRGLADVALERFDAVALVARPGAQFGLARMVALLNEIEALSTAAFQEPRPALVWLRERLEERGSGGS